MRSLSSYARRAWFIVALASSFHAGVARAEDESNASTWKARGDAAMVAGRAADALESYRRAAALEPSPKLDFNIGRALLAMGDMAGALEAFERYDRTAPDDLKAQTHRLAEVMAELRGKVAALEVVAVDDTAKGAEVFARGKALGRLPTPPFTLNPGQVEVRVARSGYEPFVQTLELAPGDKSRLDVALRRIVSSLAIASAPTGASVEVDGVLSGPAPLTLALSPGDHQIVVRAPRYQPRTVRVSLAEGKTRQVDVQLAPEAAPLTSRWYFWTGVGVIAAGVATAIIAANVERSPSRGSLGTFNVP